MSKEIQELIEHFKSWSGGFLPEECSDGQIEMYIESGISKNASQECIDFLRKEK